MERSSISYKDRLKILDDEVKHGCVSSTDQLVTLEEIDHRSQILQDLHQKVLRRSERNTNVFYSMEQEKARTTTVLHKTDYSVRRQKQRNCALRMLARDIDLERKGTIKEKPSHDFKSSNQRCYSHPISDWIKGQARSTHYVCEDIINNAKNHAHHNSTDLRDSDLSANFQQSTLCINSLVSSAETELDTLLSDFHYYCDNFDTQYFIQPKTHTKLSSANAMHHDVNIPRNVFQNTTHTLCHDLDDNHELTLPQSLRNKRTTVHERPMKTTTRTTTSPNKSSRDAVNKHKTDTSRKLASDADLDHNGQNSTPGHPRHVHLDIEEVETFHAVRKRVTMNKKVHVTTTATRTLLSLIHSEALVATENTVSIVKHNQCACIPHVMLLSVRYCSAKSVRMHGTQYSYHCARYSSYSSVAHGPRPDPEPPPHSYL